MRIILLTISTFFMSALTLFLIFVVGYKMTGYLIGCARPTPSVPLQLVGVVGKGPDLVCSYFTVYAVPLATIVFWTFILDRLYKKIYDAKSKS